MAIKHMKGNSTLLIIREMHTKTTVIHYLTPIRMATTKKKKSTSNIWLRGCGKKGTLLLCWWEYKLIQSLWRTVWRVLKKLRIELPYDSAVLLLGTYSARVLSCVQLFVTPKTSPPGFSVHGIILERILE